MAKLTQRMYGKSNQAAGRDIFAKVMIVARMASQRNIISTNAPHGECRPKKIIDQSVFKMSWPMNMPRAILTSLRSRPFFQIRNAEIPIRANSVVQTGPNTHAGGLRAGLTIPAYQPTMEGVVNTEPMMPASSETTMAMISLRVLFIKLTTQFVIRKLALDYCLPIFKHFQIFLKLGVSLLFLRQHALQCLS